MPDENSYDIKIRVEIEAGSFNVAKHILGRIAELCDRYKLFDMIKGIEVKEEAK